MVDQSAGPHPAPVFLGGVHFSFDVKAHRFAPQAAFSGVMQQLVGILLTEGQLASRAVPTVTSGSSDRPIRAGHRQ